MTQPAYKGASKGGAATRALRTSLFLVVAVGLPACRHPAPDLCAGTIGFPYRPPSGCAYLFAGQDPQSIGGLPDAGDTDGYLDHISTAPAGITLYGAFPTVGDTTPLAQMPWVAAAESYVDQPGSEDLIFHLSIAWVPESLADNVAGRQAIETALLAGQFDWYIDQLATWLSARKQPVLLRLGYEFNRPIHVLYSQQYYVPCFQHIVDRLRGDGVQGVAYVWASANLGFQPVDPPPDNWDFDAWYPGDDYVDWYGFSMWYPAAWDTVMLPQARVHNKPLLLAETTPSQWNVSQREFYPLFGTVGQPVTDNALWSGWWQPMLAFVESNKDIVGGWHYIAENWNADPEWAGVPIFTNCDARLWLDPTVSSRWSTAVAQPPFVQRGHVRYVR